MTFLHRYRHVIMLLWGILFVSVLYLYFYKPDIFETYLRAAFEASAFWGYTLFLFLGCVRGFVFLPATTLIVLGFLFFTPHVLFVLSMVGILVSSTLAYWFARSLGLGEEIEKRDSKHVALLRSWLTRYELPVLIVWSGLPFTPTDVICYVCGALKINYGKFILGIAIGESICVGIYVYFGEYVAHTFFS